MQPIIIDRRKNSGNKNLANRQRFLDRAKRTIKESAQRALQDKSIADKSDTNVNIPTDGINEPRFIYSDRFGEYDHVVPGNDDFIVGDIIKKKKQDQSSGGGSGGNGDGENGEDNFEFSLNYDEFINVIFDDLELPDLVKQTEKHITVFSNQRAGFTKSGIPTNLNIERTMISSIGRRIALKSAKKEELKELYEELMFLEDVTSPDINEVVAELKDRIEELEKSIDSVPFIDNVDLRYNNYIKVPKPITQAVMFCVLDVSFSMGEHEKLIAKKFFLLLNLFLKIKYGQDNVDIVFIKHHDRAKECDEEEFFTSKESGGTIVSSAYKVVDELIKKKYSPDEWNIYISQASDGDNYPDDNVIVEKLLTETLLPNTQYFTYIEIDNKDHETIYNIGGVFSFSTPYSALYKLMTKLAETNENMGVSIIGKESEVIARFRHLFGKKVK